MLVFCHHGPADGVRSAPDTEMSHGTRLPVPDPVQMSVVTADGAGMAEELVKADFQEIYAVYLDNLQQKASLFKLLISFVISPYLVAVALLSTKALEFDAIDHLGDLPTFLDFVIVVAGAGLLLPLSQYIEYDDNVMRTARSINHFRSLYAHRLGITPVWRPNLPIDYRYPMERQLETSGCVLVLVFMGISVAYVLKGLAGLANLDLLNPLTLVVVVALGAIIYGALAWWYLRSGRNPHYEISAQPGGPMSSIIASDVGRAWATYLDHVVHRGQKLGNEPDPIFEAPAVAVTIEKVDEDDAMVQQYGDQEIKELYVRKMFSHEVVAELGTTYGDRLFSYDGHDQIAAAIERLKAHWWTNKATLTLLDPLERWPDRRMPCLTVVDLKIRDNRLHLFAFFRSQNVLNSYGNMYGLGAIQTYCAEQLEVKEGTVTLFVSSPHVYERDLDRARQIVEAC